MNKAIHLLVLSAFIFTLGCADEKKTRVVSDPESFLGHQAIHPEKKYVYSFLNTSHGMSSQFHAPQKPEKPGEKKKKEVELVGPGLWSSTCAGELHFDWKGYEKLDGFNTPLATFSYNLKKLSHEESGKDSQGRTWSEKYDDQVYAEVLLGGRKVKNPRNGKLGVPVELYVQEGSLARFYPNGRAVMMDKYLYQCNNLDCRQYLQFKEKTKSAPKCPHCKDIDPESGNIKESSMSLYRNTGELMEKARFLKGSNLGQYFLNGVRIDYIAHRLGGMTPPLGFNQESKWTSPMSTWVEDYGKKIPQPVEEWVVDKEADYEGQKVWLIRSKSSQKLRQARIRSNQAQVYGWTYQVESKYYLDPETWMPLFVEVQDVVEWMDILPNIRDKTHIQVLHKIINKLELRATAL